MFIYEHKLQFYCVASEQVLFLASFYLGYKHHTKEKRFASSIKIWL